MPLNSPNQPQRGEQITRPDNSLTQKFRAWCEDVAAAIGGAGGTFLGLSDTPNDYTGQAGNSLIVNPGEDGLVFGSSTGLPTGYITGYVTLPNSGSPDEQIDIGVGAARSSDDVEDIRLTAGLTKDLTATWVAGDGNGGRATGVSLTADTWYHMFVITNGTDVDAGFDTDIACTNLLADSGYTQFRRIGSVLTDGSSDIIPYVQNGNEFLWANPPEDLDDTTPGTGANLATLSVPIDVSVLARFRVNYSSVAAVAYLTLSQVDQDDVVPGATTFSLLSSTGANSESVQFELNTDTAAQIRYRSDTSPVSALRVVTRGWVDSRADFQSGGAGQIQRATTSEYCPGYTFTFVDTDTWRVTGIDATNLFSTGRRLKFIDGSNTYFGSVVSSSFGTDTDIDMSMESGDVLTNTITEVCLVTGATAWSPIIDDPFSGTPINAIATGAIGGTQWWVIVGDAGRLATSTDGGLNWIVRTTGVAENFVDVKYNGTAETFIATAFDGRLVRSSNGATWSNPNDLNSVVTTGDGKTYICYDPEDNLWLAIIQRATANYASYSAPDAGAMTWTLRETGFGSNARNVRQWTIPFQTTSQICIPANDDVFLLTSALDTATSTSWPNQGFQIHDAYGFPDSGISQDRACLIGSTGNIRITDANGNVNPNTDTVTFTQQLNRVVYSPLHDRLVVVGDVASLGYLSAQDSDQNDAWTFVASGFAPLSNILCVDWNQTDGIFIAGADNGQICRSSNGTN